MTRLLALVVILALPACAPSLVRTDVTRFHRLDTPAAADRAFTILPREDQRGSLEFQRYADLVAAQLARRGWRPVPASGPAEAVVFLDWGAGEPRTVTWQSPSSVYSGFGWGPRSHWYGAGVGIPLGDPFPYWETRSATYYPKWMRVEILEAGAWREQDRRVLFEGRAVTEGGRREIAPVMPYLVEALFTGFPGASGTTVNVDVPIRE
ncbi:MAG: DUF4136 domain-containing protein [Pseudomonadota bacterium]